MTWLGDTPYCCDWELEEIHHEDTEYQFYRWICKECNYSVITYYRDTEKTCEREEELWKK